ncbi:MAG: aminotransferase class III-fold pyridoxal phosphate-dependent enzyme, partial [Rhodobacterales bacterium]
SYIIKTGENITARWKELGLKYDLSIETSGLPSLTSFIFNGPNAQAYKTLVTQEMLKQGFLAANSVYVCTAHTPNIVDKYFQALEPIFATVRECEQGLDVLKLLDGPFAHNGFSRLN